MRGHFTMTYLERSYQRYHTASKADKGRILDELCQVCGINRKYAIRKLSQPLPTGRPQAPPKRSRPTTYGLALLGVIKTVWEEAGYPWSVRLKAILKGWLPWIRERFRLSPDLERQMLTISPRTLDRALKPYKRALKRRLYGRTKPGTLLRHQIPIKTDHWDVQRPGSVEVDLVSHSGPSAQGEFLYSLNLTDIFSTWVETRAVKGRGEAGVLHALQEIRHILPFPLSALDSDNGSEFLNHHLVKYCQQTPSIQFTRSRPYKKDDNAHIEQKNWTHVRKLLGWDRYDSPQALEAINTLYRHELRLWMNLFQPSVRLVKTVRVGSRLKRFYDAPQTPLERLLASRQGDPGKVAELKALRDRTDPFELSRKVREKLERIWHLARHRPVLPPRRPVSKDGLSTVERETMTALSEVFGMKVYYRSRTGELVPITHDKA